MIYRNLFGLPVARGGHPVFELDRIRRQMDRLMDTFMDPSKVRTDSGVFPAVSIAESADDDAIRAELPGVDNDQLDIQVTGKSVAISGKRDLADEGAEVKYHRRERQGGAFSRMVTMPGDVNADKITAKLVNGILEIRLPKAEAAKPRKISIANS